MKRDEKTWLKQLRALTPEQQELLFSFTEFLVARAPAAPTPMLEPQLLPRPVEEKVIHAIKRLRMSYPMLDESVLLSEVSEHLTQHLMFGKPAPQVIDELEVLFRAHYDKLCAALAAPVSDPTVGT